MGRKWEDFKEYIFNDWGLLRYTLVIYTLGIFYILGSGLRGFKVPSPDSINLYGIDRVSGYYGPGSWAAWLLTTAACCIDRLFRRPKTVSQTEGSFRRFCAGMDINMIGVYSYPIIAGVDLLLRARRDFSSEDSAVDIGCLCAPLVILKMGTGLGFLLAGICLRRWGEHGTDKAPAVFSSLLTYVLLLMSIIFDCILINLTPRDAALNFFLLPGATLHPISRSALATLLVKSRLLEPESYIPLLSSFVAGGDMNGVGMLVVYPLLVFCLLFFLYSKQRLSWRLPLYACATIVAAHAAFFFTFTIVLFISYFFPVYFWSFPSPPITTLSILDLDQLSFLFLGGALIVANSGVQLVRENHELVRSVSDSYASAYNSLAHYLQLQPRRSRRRASLPISSFADQGIPLDSV
ncbi:hypothetical protein BKA65DRAFT_555186 [Rhexocercosporidium sp. MPI-PUGE-AT-0058]|nr:hypothetical protein BKA65DRAFT_555186 [Rhexocercosporidium sp. MPI-PUGE-AT-0058]